MALVFNQSALPFRFFQWFCPKSSIKRENHAEFYLVKNYFGSHTFESHSTFLLNLVIFLNFQKHRFSVLRQPWEPPDILYRPLHTLPLKVKQKFQQIIDVENVWNKENICSQNYWTLKLHRRNRQILVEIPTLTLNTWCLLKGHI